MYVCTLRARIVHTRSMHTSRTTVCIQAISISTYENASAQTSIHCMHTYSYTRTLYLPPSPCKGHTFLRYGTMGKKTRRNRGDASSAHLHQPLASVGDPPHAQHQLPSSPTARQAIYYASDGPSDVELLQTTSSSLQAKLDQLTNLGLAEDRAGFVSQFVPIDLSLADADAYVADLTTAPEAEGQWTNLVAEIAAIRCGKGVDRIEGDQVTRAVFFFSHPLLEKCDREVAFCCTAGEWRAEG